VQPVAPVGTADPDRAPPDWFGSVNLYLGEDRLCGLLLEIDWKRSSDVVVSSD
jgi:hypothetical protein